MILQLLFKKTNENIILYTTNEFDSYFNKKYIIYLYRTTYFSKDSKNHPSDDTWLRKHIVMFHDKYIKD